jgi:CHASE2 domain-containing sensor protein
MHYDNLELWVERRADGTFLIQGRSDQGDFRENASVPLDSIAIDADALGEGRIGAEGLKALGERLYGFLFRTGPDAKLATLLDRSLGAATQAHHGLRIRLQLDEANPDVAAVPWEYLYRPADDLFMATRVETPIVRYLSVGVPLRRLEVRLPLNMLVLIPAVEQLNTALEVSLLDEAAGSMRGAVKMNVLDGIVTPDRVEDVLRRDRYDIVHFVGHGDFAGDRPTLRFNDAAGGPLAVDHETLGRLVQNEMTLRLVVLNSCKGAAMSSTRAFLGMAPRLVQAGVPAAVAMQYPIRDDEALCFVKAFYGALFEGDHRGSVDFAICSARSALDRAFPGTRAFGVPVVFMRYRHGVLFRVVTGRLLQDAPFRRHDAVAEAAIIDEMERSQEEVLAASGERPLDERTRTSLTIVGHELERARRRLRFRHRAMLGGVMAALVAALAFAVGILEPLPLTWVARASPVWFGDPLGRSLEVGDIAIVTSPAIDTSWRPRHAVLIDRLAEAGARVVVFDLFFERSFPTDDSVLAEAFGRARGRGTRIVVGTRDIGGGGQPAVVPALAAQASVGSVCLGTNRARFSGIVPVTWVAPDGKRTVPSLALAAVAAWKGVGVVADLDRATISLVDEKATVTDRVRAARVVTVKRRYPQCPMFSEGSRYAELFASRARTAWWRDPARRVDYATVLAAAPAELAWARDKIVLIGAPRPEEVFRQGVGFTQDERYGVERHADAIATILSDAEVLPLRWGWQLVIIFLGAAAGGWSALRSRRGRRWRDAVLLASAVVGFGVVASIAYRTAHTLVDVIYPSLALFLAYAMVFELRRRWLT